MHNLSGLIHIHQSVASSGKRIACLASFGYLLFDGSGSACLVLQIDGCVAKAFSQPFALL